MFTDVKYSRLSKVEEEENSKPDDPFNFASTFSYDAPGNKYASG
jgi:hypothetical protein